MPGLGDWWRAHCAPFVTELEKPEPIDREAELAEAVAKLAAKHHSPEHPVEVAKAAPKPAPPKVAAAEVEVVTEPVRKNYGPTAVRRGPKDGWRIYVGKRGTPSTYIETNDEGLFRCGICFKAGIDFTGSQPRSISGHYRTSHLDVETLWGQSAQARKSETRTLREMEDTMSQALTVLAASLGVQWPPPPQKETKCGHVQEIKALQQQLDKITQAHAALIKERDDAKARLALIRESLSA
jgi:hypothetical protein